MPKQKVAAAEAFLANIINQAAAWPRQRVQKWRMMHNKKKQR